ncbi:MAG: RluA family pseudouridine synthase [Limnohabitans sp.]|nr:RluA family pseudouridine synthase [Limnohabitans sp.]
MTIDQIQSTIKIRSPIQWAHQDESVLVAIKPPGLLSVPGTGPLKQDCLLTKVQQTHTDALLVHRLDQATSGLMLTARGAQMQRQLSHAFAQRQVKKTYIAWVNGYLTIDSQWQTIDRPIDANWAERPLRHVSPNGKSSQTLWRCRTHHPQLALSLIELQPLTGRTHQLRVHMKDMGHPIYGDTLYAKTSTDTVCDHMMLHACSLELLHPISGQKIHWHSKPHHWLSDFRKEFS